MLTYLIYIFKHDLFVIICQTLFSYFFLACITKNWLFMFPFFPNIVTFSIGLKGACTYSMWSIVEHLLSRVCSGEWRSLRTRNLAPSRSLTPLRTSEGCERCRYAFRDRSCSPPVPVVTSHIRLDERSRGASDDRYACCRRLLPHSLRHASDVTAFIVTWDFWVLWRILYFLI